MGFFSRFFCGGLTLDPTLGDPELAEAREGLIRGDHQPARKLMGQTREPTQREFVANALGLDQTNLAALRAWTTQTPGDADGWILLGISGTYWAWEARSNAMAMHVSDQQFVAFFERLEEVDQALKRAASLAPRDPLPHAQRIFVDVGLQRDKQNVMRHFGKATRRQDPMRLANDAVLMYLCEKWFGSTQEMFTFARAQAEKHKELIGLIPAAHVEHWVACGMYDRVQEANVHFAQPAVRQEISKAFRLFRSFPQHHPIDMRAANMFAYCFMLMEDRENAKAVFEIIGDRVLKFPWVYNSKNPARMAHRARRWANA